MKPLSAGEIAKVLKGTLIQGSAEVTVKDGAYYLEKINKPNMILFLRLSRSIDIEKISKFTPCVIVSDKNLSELEPIKDCTVVKVDNIEIAFWAFVHYYRSLFNIPVVAVTGTCGKSTTKDMIMHILSHKLNIQGTDVSANSRTHNFSYLLRLDENTEAAIFETAVGKPGDITNSCKFFAPNIGIIANISMDHLEGCKTMDNYIRAKGEMLTCLGDNGVLILNSDDENIKKLPLSSFKGRIIYFGINTPSDFNAADIKYSKNGMSFKLTFKSGNFQVFVPGYGYHQVYNALAAFSAVHELGIDLIEAGELLKTFKNLPYHIQVDDGLNGSIIIDDTWNTNPSSLKAAIEVLSGIANGRKKFLLMGDMNALGGFALNAHLGAGDMIASSGAIDVLITIGPMAAEASNRALMSGFKGEVYKYDNVGGIFELLADKLDSNSILLIKSAGYHDKTILNLSKKLRLSTNK